MAQTSIAGLGSNAEAYERLQAIDWTFASAQTRGETHGIHPYPAKFIPQIPRTLIQHLYPGDGSAVMDPFCGSGTTLVEAATAGIPAIGIDIHPLACLISRVKVTPVSGSVTAAADRVVARIARHSLAAIPNIPSLDHWFQQDVQQALASIVQGIDDERDEAIRNSLQVAFSSIIVRVSNQDSDTRYAAIKKNVTASDVPLLFLRAAQSIERALASTWPANISPPPVRIINKDVLTVDADDIGRRVSLVVSSPPYPNAYEYWLYHKYRMYWLGMDPIAVREREIGARPHYFKKKPQTATDFENQMATVFRLLSRVLLPGGHACFQVGRSVIHGNYVNNSELLSRAAATAGFRKILGVAREIPLRRKAFNPHHAKIVSEDILVFRQEHV